MKSIFAPILSLFLLTSFLFADDSVKTSVAKIDYGEIDDLLVSVVLNSEGNEELKDRYYTKKKAAKDAQEKLQADMMSGKGFDLKGASFGMMHNDPDQKKVDQLCQKHLLEVIERVFKDKYDFVFKDDYRSSLLFSRIAIEDVTIIIRQELLKALPKN